MLERTAFFLVTVFLLLGGLSRKGFGPGEQEWGHIDIREGAHMFYWLYYVQAENIQPVDRPLIIWLQGGPGATSTGFGNFMEIGPIFLNGTARPHSWAQYANILFIDNPVGAGFSYVDDDSYFTNNNEEIGSDMVLFLKEFYKLFPEMLQCSLYIFSESYGGKMAVEIAKQLTKSNLQVDLKGLGLFGPGIHPMDSVNGWAPYLYHTGFLDRNGFDQVSEISQAIEKFVENNQWDLAMTYRTALVLAVNQLTVNIDFYNILRKMPVEPTADEDDAALQLLMDETVREALQINNNVTFASQRPQLFRHLSTDFMKPVADVVEELLNTTSIDIAVLSGQLDLVSSSINNMHWVDNLKWNGSSEWYNATRAPIVLDGYIEGYQKKVGKLAFYWINRSGHMSAKDNPATSLILMRQITGL